MNQKIWQNKSNGQLCITIPKKSGLKDGDVVSISRINVKKVVYCPFVGENFHFGHIKFLNESANHADILVCGVLTDKAVKEYRSNLSSNFTERYTVLSSLRMVDMVLTQQSMDPSENLIFLKDSFPNSEIILSYGTNWKEIPGINTLKNINGKLIQPECYFKLSNYGDNNE